MVPCEFWPFLRFKTPLKGSRFDSCENIIQQGTCTQLQNKPSRCASSDGRTARLSVWSHTGPTLKGIRYSNHSDRQLCFPGPRSDTFCTGLALPFQPITIWYTKAQNQKCTSIMSEKRKKTRLSPRPLSPSLNSMTSQRTIKLRCDDTKCGCNKKQRIPQT
jgi:hypothetical protein